MSFLKALQGRLVGLLGRTAFRHTVIFVVGNVIAAFVPFLMLPLFTRVLTTEEYGLFAVVTVIVGVLFPIANLGLSNVVARDFVDRFEIDYPRLVTTCCALCAFALVVVSVVVEVMALVSPSLFERVSGGLSRNLLPAVYAMVAGQVVITIGLSLLQMERRPAAYSVVRIGQAVAFAVAGAIAVLPLAGQGNGLVFAKAIVDAAVIVGVLWWMVRQRYLVPRVSSADARRALAYGLPLIPHMLAVGFTAMIDRILLANMVGVGAVGIYAVGYQVGLVMWLIVNSINQAWLPWFFEAMKEGTDAAKYRVVRVSYAIAAVLVVLAIIFAAASPLLIRVLAGPEFQEASAVCPWIILGFLFQGLYTLSNCHLYYANRTVLLAAATITTAVANWGLTWLLIGVNGIIGAAQGTAIAYFLAFVLVGLAATRISPMPWLRVILMRP